MCATCGCGGEHVHEHDHEHEERGARTIRLEREILAKNDALARENRAALARAEAFALNLLGSPGAGKTTLLERTIRDLRGRAPVSVIEGDQETDRDASRIRAAGARAIQINTRTGCHLDAHAVGHALAHLAPEPRSIVVIENVGNLVCPALFDLGERAKVVVLSVTEGDDKPLKYPHMFRACDAVVFSKIDLLPHVAFDVAQCLARARSINPALRDFRLSATTGDGVEKWLAWLLQEAAQTLPADRRSANARA